MQDYLAAVTGLRDARRYDLFRSPESLPSTTVSLAIPQHGTAKLRQAICNKPVDGEQSGLPRNVVSNGAKAVHLAEDPGQRVA
jgi:hypothetical protein